MTLGEIIVEAEFRRPRDPSRDLAGSLTQDKIDALRAIDFDAPLTPET